MKINRSSHRRKNRERELEIAGTAAFKDNKQETASFRFCH
jgi:hypothetical protein